MIFIVSQYVIGFTCHNESMLIGLFRQRQFADERKWLFVSADVRGAGTPDEPLRTSAWEASVNAASKTIYCKTAKLCQQKYCHINILASLQNKQSFYSIAEFFVRFTRLSERKVSLQEEKSNLSSRKITAVK